MARNPPYPGGVRLGYGQGEAGRSLEPLKPQPAGQRWRARGFKSGGRFGTCESAYCHRLFDGCALPGNAWRKRAAASGTTAGKKESSGLAPANQKLSIFSGGTSFGEGLPQLQTDRINLES